ncbi:MAG TPA: tetratricopeptide repeat protein [Rhodothermales bacterium]|nr:tetratricopeptide repeat protein [Rhodothermales bacterium]
MVLRFSAFILLIGIFVAVLHPSSARAQAEPGTPEKEFATAFQLYSNQLYEQAIHDFQAFRTEYPGHISIPEALYYQAESALALGREDEAVRLFDLFRQEYPEHPLAMQASLAVGKYFFDAGDYERAIDMLKGVLASRPPEEIGAKTLYLMAESALASGRTDEGLDYYRRAAAEYPGATAAPRALFALGYRQVALERLEDAARTFEVLASKYPASPYVKDVGLVLANVYFQLHDYENVIDEVERRRGSLEGEALERADFLAGESYNKLGDFAQAETYYRRLTEGRPGSPYYRSAEYGLGWTYYQDENYARAAEQFEAARQQSGDSLAEKATYYEGVSRRLAGASAEAISLWQQYLDRWPDGALAQHALYETALAYYDAGRWEEAEQALNRFVRQYADIDSLGQAWYLLGNVNVALGETDAALRNYDRALSSIGMPAGAEDEIAYQQARALYTRGQYAQAADALYSYFQEHGDSDRAGDALFWAAESNFQADRMDNAVRLFLQYTDAFSGGAHADAAQYALAWSYFKKGEYGRAAENFEQFLSQYQQQDGDIPYRTDATLRLGDSYYALKRYSDAVQAYGRAADEGGGKDYVLYQTGQARANSGNTDRAIATFQQLLQQYPQSQWAEEAQYKIGSLYFQTQQYDQAIAEYQKLIDTWPRDPLAARAQYSIGDALYNAGRLDEAVTAYRAVLDDYPKSPFTGEAASSIQFALMSAGKKQQAKQILDSYTKNNPDSPVTEELRFRQAEVAYQSGDTDEALRAFKDFVSVGNDPALLADAYYYMAEILVARGHDSEAEAYIRRIIQDYEDSPRRADAALLRGNLYLSKQLYSDAIDNFRLAESDDNGSLRTKTEARYGEARALLGLGQTDEAEKLLGDALQQDPNSPEAASALLGIAQLYEQQNRTEDALRYYRQVVDQSRDDTGAEALYRLGNLLLETGDADAAVKELDRIPALYPDFPKWIAQGYLTEAKAYQALNQTSDAARMYDLVINRFGDTEYARTAKAEKESL